MASISKLTGAGFIDNLMESVGKIQTKASDTNYRVIALNWLNRIVEDISSRQRHWKWLEKTSTFDTVADQLSYDLPADIQICGWQKKHRVSCRWGVSDLLYDFWHRRFLCLG